ncbi:MAG TPA: TetR family transcriptional regulator [Candidatus Avilachnospira avistercoris]|nr:TetR family transcriptional regulator [Candidatus Avilachnospira avistercoris]
MPKGSEELTNARKDEIIDACASLYEEHSFRDITIRDIGERTSFTRTSIYNYFQTKEEIFLALLEREYTIWEGDIRNSLLCGERLDSAEFSDRLAHTLEKRGCMLKLLTMNLYDMEGASRLDNLVSFKRIYHKTLITLSDSLRANFEGMDDSKVQGFLYAFFPFLFGVYPYTSATDKQKEAMELVGLKAPEYSIYELVRDFTEKLLLPF